MRAVAILAKILTRFDPPPAAPVEKSPPVVVVHGIWATGADMERLTRHLRARGRRVIQPTLTPATGSVPIEELARQLSHIIESENPDEPIEIVAFSMGGLVARYYLQRLGGLARTRRLITMATPHNGTVVANLSRAPAPIQMRPRSAFLGDLASDADVLRAIPFTSFYTPLDTIIIPAWSSVIPQARNIRIWASLHPSFLLEMRCIRAMSKALHEDA